MTMWSITAMIQQLKTTVVFEYTYAEEQESERGWATGSGLSVSWSCSWAVSRECGQLKLLGSFTWLLAGHLKPLLCVPWCVQGCSSPFKTWQLDPFRASESKRPSVSARRTKMSVFYSLMTYHHLCCILLHMETICGTLWERTGQGHAYQEVGTAGGHLEGCQFLFLPNFLLPPLRDWFPMAALSLNKLLIH